LIFSFNPCLKEKKDEPVGFAPTSSLEEDSVNKPMRLSPWLFVSILILMDIKKKSLKNLSCFNPYFNGIANKNLFVNRIYNI